MRLSLLLGLAVFSGPFAWAQLPPLPSLASTPLKLDGAWEASPSLGVQVLLRERGDGSVLGYISGEPGVYLAQGSIFGRAVSLTFGGEDGGGTMDPVVFTGTFLGSMISGSLDDGSGSTPLTLTRSTTELQEEHWILFEDTIGAEVQAARLTDAGMFFGGGMVGRGQCDFIACGSTIDSWGEAGSSHTIQVSSSGSCTSASTLLGVFDPVSFLMSGSYTTTNCSSSTSGTFLGGKEGLTTTSDAEGVLALVTDLCDALEAESASAADALHSTYLHDGKTRADWAAEFAAWYAAYDSIEVSAVLSQVITLDDGEIHPFLWAPQRLEWHLTVTGLPTAGGPVETLLDHEPGFLQDDLHYLGTEAGQFVFVGNDELTPFAINMPIAAGDGDLVTFGLWPYGVHGGGHPEGHPGMDIEYAPGAPVRAAAAGTVTYIDNNTNFPTQWDLLLEVRPGVLAQYDHMGAIDPSITVGTVVIEGQVLGEGSTPFPHSVVHFGLRHGVDTLPPSDYLNASGQAVFDSLWVTARYAEELVEPLSNNPVDVSFPLTISRTLVSGSLPARMEFTRDDPTTYDTTYALYDAAGTLLETGTASYDPFNTIAEIDLVPTSPAGPKRLGVLDILGEDLWIDWSTTSRPTSLGTASHYQLTD